MLPVLLYKNMEEGSNSLNNGSGNGYNLLYDESVIINSVRSRKKVTELPNCPVCSCTIRQGELETHLQLEMERLNKLSAGGTKRKLSANSSGGSTLAMPGSSTSPDVPEDEEFDVSGSAGGEVYQRVHHNRIRRLRLRRRATPPPEPPVEGQCPVCNETFPTYKLQRHALRCLKRTGADIDDDVADTSDEDCSIDVENDEPGGGGGGSFGAEYQWCGEWRVRATALVEPSSTTVPSTPTPSKQANQDCPLVVDGDEDLELYGPPQYSPTRITPDPEPPETSTEAQNGTEDTIITNSIEHTNGSTNTTENKTEVEHNAHKPNGLVEASAETRIQALKARIRELESKQTANDTKCLICLSPHTAPAVSIQCWHVYCEECWLQSLHAKKICPQCNIITTTQHLRRIYM